MPRKKLMLGIDDLPDGKFQAVAHHYDQDGNCLESRCQHIRDTNDEALKDMSDMMEELAKHGLLPIPKGTA